LAVDRAQAPEFAIIAERCTHCVRQKNPCGFKIRLLGCRDAFFKIEIGDLSV
jgi:hypothetical protein